MGTWGYGPFDSDDAADMIAGLMRPIEKVVALKKAPRAYQYNQARAACQIILLAHGTDVLDGPSLDKVLRALARMRGDVEWLASWLEPGKLSLELNTELSMVQGHMMVCRNCRKQYAKGYRAELNRLADEARATPIPKSSFPGTRKARKARKARLSQ